MTIFGANDPGLGAEGAEDREPGLRPDHPRVRIAVVDTGVHASHPHVGGVAGGVGFDEAGQATGDFVDRLERDVEDEPHGFAAASLVCRAASLARPAPVTIDVRPQRLAAFQVTHDCG